MARYVNYLVMPYVEKGKEITPYDIMPEWVKHDLDAEQERFKPKKKADIKPEKLDNDIIPNETKWQRFRRLALEEEEKKLEAELVDQYLPKFD